MADSKTAETSIDPIWNSSGTSRQIYALTETEKDVARLLSSAGACMALLSLPETDDPTDNLPQSDERSEQFTQEAKEYFDRLDAIHMSIRQSIAYIRHARIAPAAIDAPPLNFIPPSLGVGLSGVQEKSSQGLQADRVDRDAWVGIREALSRLKTARQNDIAHAQDVDDMVQ